MSEMDLHESTQAAAPGLQDDLTPGLVDEATEADAVEQQAAVAVHERTEPVSAPDEADPADVADQHRVVELDEDDYR